MSFAGQGVARTHSGPNAASLQLLAAPGNGYSEQRKGRDVDRSRVDNCLRTPNDEDAKQRAQNCGEQARTEPRNAGSNEHRRHEEQVGRFVPKCRREEQAGRASATATAASAMPYSKAICRTETRGLAMPSVANIRRFRCQLSQIGSHWLGSRTSGIALRHNI